MRYECYVGRFVLLAALLYLPFRHYIPLAHAIIPLAFLYMEYFVPDSCLAYVRDLPGHLIWNLAIHLPILCTEYVLFIPSSLLNCAPL